MAGKGPVTGPSVVFRWEGVRKIVLVSTYFTTVPFHVLIQLI